MQGGVREPRPGHRRDDARRHVRSAQVQIPAGLRDGHVLPQALPSPPHRPRRRRVFFELHVRQKTRDAVR